MAVSDSLEDAIVARITGLGLKLGDVDVIVQRRKAPKVERGLERQPLIQVTSSQRPGRNDWFCTGDADFLSGRKRCEYAVEVTMSAPGDRDPTADQDDYREWRQAICRAFEPPSVLGVQELFDVSLNVGAQYDREGFARNIDHSRIDLICVTIETASN